MKIKRIIIEKIELIEENLELMVGCYNDYNSEKNIRKKKYLKHALAKFVEEIIENAIKINNIILEHNKDYANNYYQTFSKLKNHYKIDEEFLEEIAKTTSFRNNIVHNYEDKKTQENLENNIEPIIIIYQKYINIIKKELKLYK